jgi:hypothetical protein
MQIGLIKSVEGLHRPELTISQVRRNFFLPQSLSVYLFTSYLFCVPGEIGKFWNGRLVPSHEAQDVWLKDFTFCSESEGEN